MSICEPSLKVRHLSSFVNDGTANLAGQCNRNADTETILLCCYRNPNIESQRISLKLVSSSRHHPVQCVESNSDAKSMVAGSGEGQHGDFEEKLGDLKVSTEPKVEGRGGGRGDSGGGDGEGGGGGGDDSGGEEEEEREFGPILNFEEVMREAESRGVKLPSDMLEAAKTTGIRKLFLLRYLDLEVEFECGFLLLS